MKLPLLISIPHGGLGVPDEVTALNRLTDDQIKADSDEDAADIFDISDQVAHVLKTDIARAFIDTNRPPDDFGKDGVVKTHTCFETPIYCEPLSSDIIEEMLAKYYHPYHQKLTKYASSVILGIDCHTMAPIGPPVGPDAGAARPSIVLSTADGTCPQGWTTSLVSCLGLAFETPVAINIPFKGGYIIRKHSDETPWVQLELSRAPFYSMEEKKSRLLHALDNWCRLKQSLPSSSR